MNNTSTRIDQDLSGELRQQFSQMVNGNSRSNRFSNTFFLFLLQGISFSVKIFIRQKIGRLTFGIGTIIIAYFWVRYFMGGDVDFLRNEFTPIQYSPDAIQASIDKMFKGIPPPAEMESKTLPSSINFFIGILEMFLKQLLVLISHGLQRRPPAIEFLPIYIFSYIVVLRGVLLLWQSRYEYMQRENLDPLSRGESIVFSGLEGKTIGQLKITPRIILMWLDPTFVVLIGLLIWLFDGNFGIFIMISGIVLFFEERAVRYRELKAVLTKLASEKWTERVLNEYREFKEGPGSGQGRSFGKATFAEDEEDKILAKPDLDEKGSSNKGTAGFA